MGLDLLLAMTQESLDKYLGDLKPDGMLIVDSSLVSDYPADRAYALDPDHPAVLGARAWVLILQGRGEAGLAMVERHLAINRNDATAWFRRCHALATLGRQDEAIRACEEAIRLSPRDADLARFYVVLAAAYLGRARLIDNLRARRRP